MDNCNADYSNNNHSSSHCWSELWLLRLPFWLWLFCFHAIFYTTKVYCWLIGFDGSRCISINKSIMLGLVRFGLGWVGLSSFNYRLPFSEENNNQNNVCISNPHTFWIYLISIITFKKNQDTRNLYIVVCTSPANVLSVYIKIINL